MSDKSLNVRVAEALGAVWCQEPLDSEGRAINAGHPYLMWPDVSYRSETRTRIATPANAAVLYDGEEYDTDWSATGPLIERFGFALWPPADVPALGFENLWSACSEGPTLPPFDEIAYAPTPLLAVCNLILALKAAGKLEPHALASVPLSR